MEVFLSGAIIALVLGASATMASVYSKVSESEGDVPPFGARMKFCGLLILFIVIFPITLVMWIAHLIKNSASKKSEEQESEEDTDNITE